VIGEGERDAARCCTSARTVAAIGVGEEMARLVPKWKLPSILWKAQPVRPRVEHAIAVLAAAERGACCTRRNIYLDKIVRRPSSRGVIDIEAPSGKLAISRASGS